MFFLNLRGTSRISSISPRIIFKKIIIPLGKESSNARIEEIPKETNSQKLPKKRDPVFEKYERLLRGEELSDTEKFYITKYGSIRLDRDNIATEIEDKSDVSSNIYDARNENSPQKDEINFIEDHYFDDHNPHSDLSKVKGSNSLVKEHNSFQLNDHIFSKDKEDLSAISTSDFKQGITTEGDLNFIDEYYFKNNDCNIKTDIDENQGVRTLNLEYDPGRMEPCEMNDIDRQYFDERNLDSNKSILQDPNEYSTSISELSVTERPEESRLNSTLSDSALSLATKDDMEIPGKQDRSLVADDPDEASKYFSFLDSFDLSQTTSNVASHVPKMSRERNLSKSQKFIYMPKRKGEVISNNTYSPSPEYEPPNPQPQEVAEKSTVEGHSSTVDALNYVKRMRRESQEATEGEEVKGGYKKIINEVPRINKMINYDLINYLKKSIIYYENDIISIDKPYGIPAHGGGRKRIAIPSIVDLLPQLAESLRIPNLYPIHRLDDKTTGVLLLAKTEERADDLKEKFLRRLVQKNYLVIVKGVPKNLNGIIDIPIAEGSVDNMRRMVLKPDLDGFRAKGGAAKKAISKYKVLSATNSCSFIELTPTTGVKHQLRVHLGFGLGCPVLGDHKYSHLDKMAPQRLPGDMLDSLRMKQSRVRDLPTFLHARSLLVSLEEGRFARIRANLPKFFRSALSQLNLSHERNFVSEKVMDIIREEI